MDSWTLFSVVLLVGMVVIAVPMAFVLRALGQLSSRTTQLMHALEEVQARTDALAHLQDVPDIEHPGGA